VGGGHEAKRPATQTPTTATALPPSRPHLKTQVVFMEFSQSATEQANLDICIDELINNGFKAAKK
jgi:hypothetical protein